MGNSKPLVSIGMPIYNGQESVCEALDSLLSQDYNNFELIISDNASTDRTADICLDYAARDSRITYSRNDQNMGAVWNFNSVFNQLSGAYVMFAAHDDFWERSFIRQCLDGYNESEELVLVSARCKSVSSNIGTAYIVEEDFSTVGLDPVERFLKYRKFIGGRCYLGSLFYGVWKRESLAKVMPVRKVMAADHLMLGRLCAHGEFMMTGKTEMTKGRAGVSMQGFAAMARALGINNWVLITFPWIVREVLFQRFVLRSGWRASEKVRASWCSLWQYIKVCLFPSVCRCLVSPVWRALARVYQFAGRPFSKPIDLDGRGPRFR